MGKSAHPTHVLIDDYVGNIDEYLSSSSGKAILVDQPWNRDRTQSVGWAETDRLHFASSLSAATALVLKWYPPPPETRSRVRQYVDAFLDW